LKRIFTILLFTLFITEAINAQRLTGTWVGDIDKDEFLQVNIVEVGNKLCGYTWDYKYTNKKDYCKAYFSGGYNEEKSSWFVNGYSFMENSGEHVLMQLTFRLDFEKGQTVLNGYCRVKPTFFSGGGTAYEISLKKVSNRPAMMTEEMKDCVKENEPPKKPIVPKKEIPVIKKPEFPIKKDTLKKAELLKKKDILKKPRVIPKPKDTIAKKQPIPPITKVTPKANTLPAQTNGRINKEVSRIVVTDRKIKLEVYDNGTIDGDTVSIFYNGKMIISHQRLSSKPIEIDVSLDENTSLHSIVLFAENLGSIPPNTALIILTTASKKRYELFSSANLQQNAELIFEYKPK
jgi:hypothetical protein